MLLRPLLVSAVVTALLCSPTGATSAPTPAPTPARPPGPSQSAYLVRDGQTWTVHDGASVVTLPDSIVDNSMEMPPQGGVFRLLGRVDAGYVLAESVGPTVYDGGLTELDLHLLRPDGTARTFYAEDGRAVGQRLRLSDDGGAVWVFHDDRRPGMDQSAVVALDGTVTPLPDRRRRVLDLPSATSLVFARAGRRAGVYRTDLARLRTTLLSPGPGARLADVADDVLVRRVHGSAEVSRLSHPTRVRWRATLEPLATDGRLLVGGSPLQVRRVGDGRLLTTLDADADQVVWEDHDHVLLADGTRLVRCGLDGVCATVAEVTGDPGTSLTLAGPVS